MKEHCPTSFVFGKKHEKDSYGLIVLSQLYNAKGFLSFWYAWLYHKHLH